MNSPIHTLFSLKKNLQTFSFVQNGVGSLVLLTLCQIQIYVSLSYNCTCNTLANWYNETGSICFPGVHNKDKILNNDRETDEIKNGAHSMPCMKRNDLWIKAKQRKVTACSLVGLSS